jgi:hypothetical protein
MKHVEWRVENDKPIAKFPSENLEVHFSYPDGKGWVIHLGGDGVGPISVPIKHSGDVYHDIRMGRDWARNKTC